MRTSEAGRAPQVGAADPCHPAASGRLFQGLQTEHLGLLRAVDFSESSTGLSTPELRELVASRMRREGACLVWSGDRNSDGYGRLRIRGRTWVASRLSFAAFVGPIAPGLLVCHRCDNPPCVHPEHLFLGTNGDNQRDRYAKGRGPVNPAKSPAFQEAVLELRAAGVSRARICTELGSPRSAVDAVITAAIEAARAG